MLILARRIGESIMVGDQVEISVVDIKGDQVKLGIKAPAQVKVYRSEVYAAIQEENRAAAAAAPGALPKIEGLMPKPPEGGKGAGPSKGGSGPGGTGPDDPGRGDPGPAEPGPGSAPRTPPTGNPPTR
jgi:carbon storage regulator